LQPPELRRSFPFASVASSRFLPRIIPRLANALRALPLDTVLPVPNLLALHRQQDTQQGTRCSGKTTAADARTHQRKCISSRAGKTPHSSAMFQRGTETTDCTIATTASCKLVIRTTILHILILISPRSQLKETGPRNNSNNQAFSNQVTRHDTTRLVAFMVFVIHSLPSSFPSWKLAIPWILNACSE